MKAEAAMQIYRERSDLKGNMKSCKEKQNNDWQGDKMALIPCPRHKVIQMERKPKLNAITGSKLGAHRKNLAAT